MIVCFVYMLSIHYLAWDDDCNTLGPAMGWHNSTTRFMSLFQQQQKFGHKLHPVYPRSPIKFKISWRSFQLILNMLMLTTEPTLNNWCFNVYNNYNENASTSVWCFKDLKLYLPNLSFKLPNFRFFLNMISSLKSQLYQLNPSSRSYFSLISFWSFC